MTHSRTPKEQMIHQQLLPCDITPGTADLFHNIDRSDFIPNKFKHLAYSDQPIPYRPNRCSLIPLYEARVLQLALNTRPFHVLVVAPQLGFIPAIFSHLNIQVTAIDSDARWIQTLQKNPLLRNVHWIEGSLRMISSNLKTFDLAIILDSTQSIPGILLNNLSPGARIITIQKQSTVHAQLTCTTLTTGQPTHEKICELSTSTLPRRAL